MVNSFRLMANRTSNTTVNNSYIGYPDLGITGVYQLPADQFGKYIGGISTTGGFGISTTPSFQPYTTWQISDDVSMTRGSHQIAFRAAFRQLESDRYKLSQLERKLHVQRPVQRPAECRFSFGAAQQLCAELPRRTPINIRMCWVCMCTGCLESEIRRLTLTAGIRWDPFFAHTNPYNETLTVSLPNFVNGVVSRVLPNAPAGMIFGGDAGLPKNQYSQNKIANFDPRVGLVWDPKGDGRMSIRARVWNLLRFSQLCI